MNPTPDELRAEHEYRLGRIRSLRANRPLDDTGFVWIEREPGPKPKPMLLAGCLAYWVLGMALGAALVAWWIG